MATANYTAAADAFSRRVQWLVEIDLDRCDRDFGSAPCTATGADGSRCYYSYETCQDLANYSASTRVWRFCLAGVPWPDHATPAFPYLRKFVPIPQKIDPAKLYVFPEKVTVEMECDWSPMPPDQDKSSYNSRTTGEFWRNLLARNRNYPGKDLRIKRGFYASGFQASDFLQVGPTYKLKSIVVTGGSCRITAESPLAELNKKEVPWSISDDNTVQNSGGIDDSVTSVTVRDASEYPDPTDYTRNTIYVRMQSEICEVTAINTSTNVLTIVRGSLNTTAASHAAGIKVEHVAFFGTDNGVATAPSADNVIEVIQDLMEWAGIASGDVDTDEFDHVKDLEITANDTYRLVTKPDKIAKHMQPLRETRGILVFIDSAGKWSCKVMGPDETSTVYDESQLIEDSVSITEDEEQRVTRVSLWYDPNVSNPGDEPADYDRVVYVIDAGLEGANYFGDQKERRIFDPWIYSGAAVSTVRNIARRLISRLRYGTRVIRFQLDVKEAELDVGAHVTIQTRHILAVDGTEQVRPCLITARKEVGRSLVEYEATDINYSGQYLRIAPTTVAADWDNATAEDKSYGCWGDSDNRVGSLKEPGSIFW